MAWLWAPRLLSPHATGAPLCAALLLGLVAASCAGGAHETVVAPPTTQAAATVVSPVTVAPTVGPMLVGTPMPAPSPRPGTRPPPATAPASGFTSVQLVGRSRLTPATGQFGRAAAFYVTGSAFNRSTIWRLDLSTLSVTRAYTDQEEGFEVQGLTLSPRRDQLAFTGFVRRFRGMVFLSRSSIMLLQADGVQTRTVAATEGMSEYVAYPRWSPDGARLAYAHVNLEPGGAPPRTQLRILSLQDGGTQVATQDGGEFFDWSPDGTELVIAQRGDQPKLAALALRDGQLRSLWEDDALDFRGVAWQPGGIQVAVEVYSQADAHPELEGLYLVNAVTGRRRKLVDGEISVLGWDPAGKRLAYLKAAGGTSSAWLFDMAVGAPAALLDQDTVPPGSSSWSPNGDALLLGVRSSSQSLCWVSIVSLKERQLSELVPVDNLDPQPVW